MQHLDETVVAVGCGAHSGAELVKVASEKGESILNGAESGEERLD